MQRGSGDAAAQGNSQQEAAGPSSAALSGPLAPLLGREAGSASTGAVPPLVTRRVLELMTYLAKHQPKVAKDVLALGIRTPGDVAEDLAGKQVHA